MAEQQSGCIWMLHADTKGGAGTPALHSLAVVNLHPRLCSNSWLKRKSRRVSRSCTAACSEHTRCTRTRSLVQLRFVQVRQEAQALAMLPHKLQVLVADLQVLLIHVDSLLLWKRHIAQGLDLQVCVRCKSGCELQCIGMIQLTGRGLQMVV